jgi:S1-C subfamily serine protease
MPTLRITSGPRSGETVPLDDEVVIGRDPAACTLVLGDDDLVSRQHARLHEGTGGAWVLRDLGSSNGTWVKARGGERQRITGDYTLNDGDEVEIGNTRFVFTTGLAAPTVVVGAESKREEPSKPAGSGPAVPPAAIIGAVGVLAVAGIIAGVVLLTGGDGGCGRQAAVSKIRQSTALIAADFENFTSQGSGFVVTGDGKVVTNAHVVVDSETGDLPGTILVRLPQGDFVATIQEYDPGIDLALLSLQDVSGDRPQDVSGATPIEWGQSTEVVDGDSLISVGYPQYGSLSELRLADDQATPTYGGKSKSIQNSGVEYIQHTATISGGNSGGPLVTECGEVVGVNTLGVTIGGQDLADHYWAVASYDAERLVNRWLR